MKQSALRTTVDLLPDRAIEWATKVRWLQSGITVLTLAVPLVVILAGFDTPSGNHNFGVIYV